MHSIHHDFQTIAQLNVARRQGNTDIFSRKVHNYPASYWGECECGLESFSALFLIHKSDFRSSPSCDPITAFCNPKGSLCQFTDAKYNYYHSQTSWTNVHYRTIDDDVLRVGVSSDAVGTGNHTTETTLMALSVPVRFAILILHIPDYSFLRAYTLNLFRLGQLRRSACHTDSTLSIPIYRKINLSRSV